MTEDKQNDAYRNSPPSSQPRPLARNTNENNPPDQKQPQKRDIKRKYVIINHLRQKLPKHCIVCPKSLQFSAKASIAPDSTFQH